MPTNRVSVDYVLVGGGLQNALLLLALNRYQPEAKVALIERGTRLGANHTWSFHSFDLDPVAHRWALPLVEHWWSSYEVSFPRHSRVVIQPYRSLSSEYLDATVRRIAESKPNFRLLTGVSASIRDGNHVAVDSGIEFEAPIVVDARGPESFSGARTAGYQKFVGLRLRLRTATQRLIPMVMDANVPQRDGFRFFYVLPFTSHRLLIEETFYSDDPVLDEEKLTESILSYAADKGYDVAEVEGSERGVLPLPGALARAQERRSPIYGGYGGGWIHPTTGYSIPAAVRLADHIARNPDGKPFAAGWSALCDQHRKQSMFCVLLNRLLFENFAPEDRRNVLERFYRLPEDTIQRFYAMTMTKSDFLRIFWGRPPKGISLRLALTKGAHR